MTRREWLNRVIGTVAAAAVAPLVDLTDMTPAFWSQPALRGVLPWRIVFPDGLTYTFHADVLSETLLADGSAEFRLQPAGPMLLSREVSYPMNFVGDPVPGTCALPPEGWFCTGDAGHGGPCPTHPQPSVFGTLLPPPDAPATVISRDGVPIGELVDITPSELPRAGMVDIFSGGGPVLGRLKREPVTFTVDFKA